MKTRPKEVARLLREAREARGLSMTQLAARAGLSHAMISFVERSLRNPTLDTLLRISVVLGVDLPELLGKAIETANPGATLTKGRSRRQ